MLTLSMKFPAVSQSPLTQALAKLTYAALRAEAHGGVLASIFGGRRQDAKTLKRSLRRVFGVSDVVSDEELATLVAHLDESGTGTVDGVAFVKRFFGVDIDAGGEDGLDGSFGSTDLDAALDQLIAASPARVGDEASVKDGLTKLGLEGGALRAAIDLLDARDVPQLRGALNDLARRIADADDATTLKLEVLAQRYEPPRRLRPTALPTDPNDLLKHRLAHRSCIEAHGTLDLSMPRDARQQIVPSSLADLSIESTMVAPTLEAPFDSRFGRRLERALAALPFLKQLWLTNIRALPCLPASICRTLSHLAVLGLSGCGLRSLPDDIGCLSRLARLYADRNSLDALPTSIARLLDLQILDLSKNAFFDFPPLPPRVRILRLADNALTDLDLAHLDGLTDLITLDLRGNGLCERSLDIQSRQSLRILTDAVQTEFDDETGLDRHVRALLRSRAKARTRLG